jgi:hypothetical protein
MESVGLLEVVGLIGFEDPYPYEFAGGMKQRVALAGALCANPVVVPALEPARARNHRGPGARRAYERREVRAWRIADGPRISNWLWTNTLATWPAVAETPCRESWSASLDFHAPASD